MAPGWEGIKYEGSHREAVEFTIQPTLTAWLASWVVPLLL
jgi:hypothetical protein